MPKRQKTVAQVDEDLKRWTTKLRRAIGAISRLENQKKRIIRSRALETLAQERPRPPVTMIGIAAPQVETDHLPEREFEQLAETMENKKLKPEPKPLTPEQVAEVKASRDEIEDGLEIPEWLKRAGPIGGKSPADLKALEEIEADKKARAKAKADKKKGPVRSSKLGPDAKRMPLSGKAALDMIKNG